MKQKIHPVYYHNAVVNCSCGNKFTTGSTQKTIKVDVCSACHPFFTGQQKFVDTQGRVERFQVKQKMAGTYVRKQKKQREDQAPLSLKEMLAEAKSKSTKK